MRFFRKLSFAIVAAVSIASCSSYDDTDLWNEVNGIKDRVSSIETQLSGMNRNIESIQALVDAEKDNVYIISVTQTTDGYEIVMSNGKRLVINNGKDGANGAGGHDGANGSTPIIGVSMVDGVYYWTITLNGKTEFLTDGQGNMIPTTGKDGEQGTGSAITPVIRVDNDGYWQISYDGGVTFNYILDDNGDRAKATGDSGGDFFLDVYQDGDYVVFVLANGTVIRIKSCGCNSTDIPSDDLAAPNPSYSGEDNAIIPNIQYSSVDENGTIVFRIDMTGIQDSETLEWLRLLGTGESGQNIWVEVDGKPKGIRVYNTVDDTQQHSVPVDLVFLVDNSGSMSEEADVIARDITEWASKLSASSLDIRFGCVGYDGAITGAMAPKTYQELSDYLNRSGVTGTQRTVGFAGTSSEISLFNSVNESYRTGGSSSNECGMAALRFASDNFQFRSGANRIYVNFTDEPNQPAGKTKFSVESLKTDWDTSLGTIHTVFSGGSDTQNERNSLMSQYTGGTVLLANSSFTNVSLESLPVTEAMRNSYIIRLTNIIEFMDGKPHTVKITILSPDRSIRAERSFTVYFTRPA